GPVLRAGVFHAGAQLGGAAQGARRAREGRRGTSHAPAHAGTARRSLMPRLHTLSSLSSLAFRLRLRPLAAATAAISLLLGACAQLPPAQPDVQGVVPPQL